MPRPVRDLYPTVRALAEAYAKILNDELKECVRAGCEFIQFDEPAWTAFPEEAVWAAEVMNQASAGLGVKIGLHVCCGNAYRKRAYTTRYQDLADAFSHSQDRSGVPGTLHAQLRHDDALGYLGFRRRIRSGCNRS